MKKWWWRIALVVVGLVLISCSLCLVAFSHLRVRREMERESVPIELPIEQVPSSRGPGLEVV